MSGLHDIVQLETPVFRLGSYEKIMLGNMEILDVATPIQRNNAKGDDGKPIKDTVLMMIIAALNASPYLRQAVIGMAFGSATRIMTEATADRQQTLDTVGWPE
jgi:hypothetical protein